MSADHGFSLGFPKDQCRDGAEDGWRTKERRRGRSERQSVMMSNETIHDLAFLMYQ